MDSPDAPARARRAFDRLIDAYRSPADAPSPADGPRRRAAAATDPPASTRRTPRAARASAA
jgi:hypothetical protein